MTPADERLARLRGRALGDRGLQHRLRAAPDLRAFAAVAAREDPGLRPGDIEAALRAVRRERAAGAPAAPLLDRFDVRGWTPVRILAGPAGPEVEWCDLRDLGGDDPFFGDRVGRALREPYRLLVRARTPIAVLEPAAQDAAAAPHRGRPAGLVLHASRSGSTLLCRMLGALPGTPVLSEPAPCDEVLRFDAPAQDRARWLRWLVAALGAGGGVVKLDAWSVRERPLLRSALPGVPWVFVFRDAAEVLASHARSPGMHVVPGLLPPGVVGLDAEAAASHPSEYAARVVGSLCRSAARELDGDALLVDYRTLPGAAAEVAAHFGMRVDAHARARMHDAARVDAKRPAERFDPVSARRDRPLSAGLRAAAERWAAPAVAELERRRLAAC